MNGIDLITAERTRQIEEEGWTATHDKQHAPGELAAAGHAYALYGWWQLDPVTGWSLQQVEGYILEHIWPWSGNWWKPSPDPVRNLVKAGALITAEIDKVQNEGHTARRGN